MASTTGYPMPKQILDYNIIKELGMGSFGAVFLAKDCNKETVAIKCIEWRETYTEREMEIAWKLEPHDNIVTVLELFQCDYEGHQFHCIVMEYCDGGNLNTHIITEKPNTQEILRYMVELAKGLAHLHKNKVIHRDLKAENVLIAHNGRRWCCKIGDFSISKLQVGNRMTMTCFGHFYEAPEVAERPKYTFSADIYSLGLLYFVMFVKETVEEDGITLLAPCMKDKKGRDRAITDCVRAGTLNESTFNDKYFAKMPKLGVLVSQMLEYEPKDRPSIAKTLSEVEDMCSSYRREKSSIYQRSVRQRTEEATGRHLHQGERRERLDKPQTSRGKIKDDKEPVVGRPLPRPDRGRREQPSSGQVRHQASGGINVDKIKDTFQLMGMPGPQRIYHFDGDDEEEKMARQQKNKQREKATEMPRSDDRRERRSVQEKMDDLHVDRKRKDSGLGSSGESWRAELNQSGQRQHQVVPPRGFSNLKDTFQLQREKCHLFPKRKEDEDFEKF